MALNLTRCLFQVLGSPVLKRVFYPLKKIDFTKILQKKPYSQIKRSNFCKNDLLINPNGRSCSSHSKKKKIEINDRSSDCVPILGDMEKTRKGRDTESCGVSTSVCEISKDVFSDMFVKFYNSSPEFVRNPYYYSRKGKGSKSNMSVKCTSERSMSPLGSSDRSCKNEYSEEVCY